MAKNNLLIRESFYFLTALVVVLFILEIAWPNIVLAYFNLNYLVILWLISGLAGLAKK